MKVIKVIAGLLSVGILIYLGAIHDWIGLACTMIVSLLTSINSAAVDQN